jgi:hypothetical protein
MTKGVVMVRGCTDFCMYIVFIIFLSAFTTICHSAIYNGDWQKMLAFFDGDWNLCGFGDVKDYPFAYIVYMVPDWPQTKANCPEKGDPSGCESFLA